jgi:hypothetical protein
MQKVSFQVDSNEGPYNGDKEYPSASSW